MMHQKLLIFVVALFFSIGLMAQQNRDTLKKQSINIVSAFKPVLRNAVKINFSGSQLNADTVKNVREYNIPSQNLFYSYQAVALKPLALQQDTNLYPGNRNFVKAGFGNYTSPLINAALGFGNGKVFLANLYAGYTSSNGNIRNQDYSRLNIKATGSYFLPKDEIYASAATYRDEYYLYGYNHSAVFPERKDIQQQFKQINLAGGIRNTVSEAHDLIYNPNVQANLFTNKDRLNETTVIIDLPAELKFDKTLGVRVDAKADLTKYNTRAFIPNYSLTNNVEQFQPSIIYHSSRLKLNAGVIPIWNNGKFEYLPNVFAEAQILQKVFIVQAGWVGSIIKNTYRNLSEINPYISPLAAQTNTREVEFYSGIKACIGRHFNFNAKLGFVHFKNFALFVNDISQGENSHNNFKISFEPAMQSLRIHGDISYISQEKFSATAAITLNGYTGLHVNARAWNTVPVEFTGSLRWQAFQKLLFKSDCYLFAGGKYQGNDGNSHSFPGGSDIGAGAEYIVTKQFSAFFDVNNILNDKYERWHNYEVYGVNFIGGIIFHF